MAGLGVPTRQMDKRAIEGIRYANIDDWDGFFKKVRDRDEALAEER